MSGKTTVYLHIGTWKTGTTALQKLCCLNERQLNEQGLLYPLDARKGSQHVPLAWYFGEGDVHDIDQLEGDPWKLIARHLGNVDKILVSTESLQLPCLRADSAREIKAKLAGADVKIIIYFRDQISMTASTYAQRIKRGFHVPTLDGWINEQAAHEYDQQLAGLWNNFGKDNVIVKMYDKSKMKNHENYRDFLNSMDVVFNEDFVVPEGISNPSLPVEVLELCRRANLASEDVLYSRKRNMHIRDMLKNSFEPRPVTDILSSNQRKRLFKKYKKPNKRLSKMINSDHKYAFEGFDNCYKSDPSFVNDDESVIEAAIKIINAFWDRQ